MTIEEKWWNKFCKVLNEMPESIEVLVGAFGELNVAERGATQQYLDKHGHQDNVETLDMFDTWHGEGIVNNGSSL